MSHLEPTEVKQSSTSKRERDVRIETSQSDVSRIETACAWLPVFGSSSEAQSRACREMVAALEKLVKLGCFEYKDVRARALVRELRDEAPQVFKQGLPKAVRAAVKTVLGVKKKAELNQRAKALVAEIRRANQLGCKNERRGMNFEGQGRMHDEPDLDEKEDAIEKTPAAKKAGRCLRWDDEPDLEKEEDAIESKPAAKKARAAAFCEFNYEDTTARVGDRSFGLDEMEVRGKRVFAGDVPVIGLTAATFLEFREGVKKGSWREKTPITSEPATNSTTRAQQIRWHELKEERAEMQKKKLPSKKRKQAGEARGSKISKKPSGSRAIVDPQTEPQAYVARMSIDECFALLSDDSEDEFPLEKVDQVEDVAQDGEPAARAKWLDEIDEDLAKDSEPGDEEPALASTEVDFAITHKPYVESRMTLSRKHKREQTWLRVRHPGGRKLALCSSELPDHREVLQKLRDELELKRRSESGLKYKEAARFCTERLS